jgi:uncharacterized protein (DUF1810 family)
VEDRYNLARFEEAQGPVYETVLAELKSGHKQSHWMWFIFPQLAALGQSERALFYGIASLDEARAYLEHPVLGSRLRERASVVSGTKSRTALEIFGTTDERKLRSSMTLFAHAAPGPSEFEDVLNKYFGGKADLRTAGLLQET